MTQIITVTIALIILSLIFLISGSLTLRIAWRNILRRKGNTLLVLIGSMVGTALIMGSFAINDTFNRINLQQAYENLGEIDIIARPSLPEDAEQLGFGEELNFNQEQVTRLEEEVDQGKIDGFMPIYRTTLATSDYDSETDKLAFIEQETQIITFDFAQIEQFGQNQGNISAVKDLVAGEVVITEKLGKALELEAGDEITVYANGEPNQFRIKSVEEEDGFVGYREGVNVFMVRDDLEDLIGEEIAAYQEILISTVGDVIKAEAEYKEDAEYFDGLLETINDDDLLGSFIDLSLGYRKQNIVEEAGESTIATFFVATSSFAILAGVLLIVNIFVLLAEERKHELGIMRALGMKRRMLVTTFFKEGILYSFFSSILGVGMGIVLGYLVITGFTNTFSSISDLGFGAAASGPQFKFTLEPTSVLVSFSAGYLLTVITVLIASIRISKLNIISAIRDLPDPRGKKKSLIKSGLILLLTIASVLVARTLYEQDNQEIKASVILGAPILTGALLAWFINSLKSKKLKARLVISTISLATLAWNIYALQQVDQIKQANEDGSISLLIIFALSLIVGSIMLVVQNFSIVTWILTKTFGFIGPFKPIIKISTRYPGLNRSTSGLTITMIALVLFMVVAVTVNTSIFTNQTEGEIDEVAGGYDGLIFVDAENNLGEVGERIENSQYITSDVIDTNEILELTSNQAQFQFNNEQIKQYFEDSQDLNGRNDGRGPGSDSDNFEEEIVEGELSEEEQLALVTLEVNRQTSISLIDSEFAQNYEVELEDRADRFETDKDALLAVATDPSLIILSSGFDTSNSQGFSFWPEVKVGEDFEMIDQNGEINSFEVIGIINANDGAIQIELIDSAAVSSSLVDKFPVEQNVYAFSLLDKDFDQVELQKELTKEFGVDQAGVILIRSLLDTIFGILTSLVDIFKAFLSFGLIVGVAGLGVIAYRSVFERRQQIGMMRALGYTPRQVLISFLFEFSYLALLGIAIGVGMGSLGMWLAFPEIEGVEFAIPWGEILYLSAIVYIASLIFVIIPSIKASRLKPVEALRYE